MVSLKDLLPPPTDGHIFVPTEGEESRGLTVVQAPASKHAGVSRVLTLPVKNNEPDYSAIVRQGENANRKVFTSYSDLVGKPHEQGMYPLPTKEEAEETARKTQAVIQKIISGKLAKGKRERDEKPEFIRYTPANSNTFQTTGSRQRIIKMVEAQSDPMEPPKFPYRKAPVNPPSPPVPVLHSPERKLSKKEAEQWKIPPVVSNWKNNRGYTISLDKRLAANGRGTTNPSINDRFADMAEALYTAERNAREDVERRARLQRQVSARAKEAKERELRLLAERARRERSGYLALSDQTDVEPSIAPSDDVDGVPRRVADEAPPTVDGNMPQLAIHPEPELSEVGEEDARRRDEIRQERRVQRDRELRKRDLYGEEGGRTLKRSKLTRDGERDISERVALGQDVGGASGTAEVIYDQRLFNQGAAGASSLAGGFGADDTYNLYDKPLFSGANQGRKFQYRGSGVDVDERERRFRADRGFGGNDKEAPVEREEARDRPVEFEKDSGLQSSANDDPYGLEKFFTDVKNAK